MLRQVSIGVRIFFIILCMLLFIGGVIGAFLYNSNVVRDISVHEVNDLMLDGQKQKISLATISLAKSLGTVLAGVDDEAERVKIIRAAIDGIRYEADNSGYIFVYEGTTVLALPPKKSLQGNDLGGMKDKNGLFVIKALAKTAKDGGGFVEYVWDKPGAGDQPKLSYATMIPGTNYWIGTGVYIDNIEAKKKVIASTIDGLMQSSMTLILGVLGLVLLFLVLPLAYLIGRSISAPVQQATEAAERISNGEFDIQLDDSGRDQVAQLMTALNAMASTLRDNIKEITTKTNEAEEKARAAEEATLLANEATEKAKTAKAEGMFHAAQRLEEVVERITTASEEISAQSEEIRQGTDVQRERLSGTATAMEEMNATVLEVAQNASLAAEQGQEAREKALHGADVVGQSIEAMDTTQRQTVALKENMTQLDEQAKAIGNIMGVITDIADQTNLLALNAAIEAARAGDAGRGFAVVADEVRKLAEKTMGATKEVGDSIDAIQTAADENVKSVELAVEDLGKATELSSQSGEVLKEIVAGAEISADQIQGIATAAEQQSASSEEINMSVDEINRIAMETAQGVQESTEALQELANQALSLNDLVQELKEEGQE